MCRVYMCPLCNTGNTIGREAGRYIIKNSFKQGCCQDCGFLLIEPDREPVLPTLSACVICGNDYFFMEGLFRKHYTCYVCEAEYRKIETNRCDKKFLK